MTMEKNILKSIKRELDEIKKEAKSEDLEVEDIIFDEYDEALINEPTKRNFKAKALKKGMAAVMLGLTLATGFSGVPNTNSNIVTVEAAKKKDKKKPAIKFDGSSKIEVEVNESVKIPKTTAKDNKDGNVTKKIAVKVTKGKKQFKDLAKKIKSNKAVTFTSTGSYVITYTVSDKAGNKATKKRYVTVKEAQKEQTTRRPAPARVVPTPATTEVPTTTETPTTEAPTTEAPTTEKDLSKYADIRKVTINGITYNVADKLNAEVTKDNDLITIHYNNYDVLISLSIGIGNNSILKDSDPMNLMLYFLGSMKVEIGENEDIFNETIFYAERDDDKDIVNIKCYIPLENGKLFENACHEIYYGDYDYLTTSLLNFYQDRYRILTCNKENEVAIVPTPKNLNWDDLFENETNKKLILKK